MFPVKRPLVVQVQRPLSQNTSPSILLFLLPMCRAYEVVYKPPIFDCANEQNYSYDQKTGKVCQKKILNFPIRRVSTYMLLTSVPIFLWYFEAPGTGTNRVK